MERLLRTLLEEFEKKLIKADSYTERAVSFPSAPNKIKVAIGMRRAGKSTFVLQNIAALLAEGVPLSRILYINFEDDRLLPMSQTQLAALLEAFYQLYPENHDQLCYLFLDEIQNAEGWPLVIRRFFDSKKVDIYLTGSSAKLLSKEIATSLRGRSLSTEIWPYSFEEYQAAKGLSVSTGSLSQSKYDNVHQHFLEYLQSGGFPEVVEFDNSTRRQTLQSYVQLVILRDIIERHAVTNEAVVKQLIKHLLHNAASLFSINKFYNDLKSQGYSVNRESLSSYLGHIEDAFLSFSVPLFTESIRKQQANPKKIYVIDTGLVNAYSLSFSKNLGRMFENIVYLDLRRQGYQIHYYLTAEREEVDFLATSPEGDKILLQVAWNTQDPKTHTREMRALQKAQSELNLPGKLVTVESYLQDKPADRFSV